MPNPLPLQEQIVHLSGLKTDPNRYSVVPQGALIVGENVNINKDGVIEGRRGMKNIYGQVHLPAGKVSRLFQFTNSILAHHNDKLSYDSNHDGSFVQYEGTYSAPTYTNQEGETKSGYLTAVEASKNVYINTSSGVKVIDELEGTPRPAGVVKALGGSAAANTGVGSPLTGFLNAGESVQYRIVWTYTDVHGTPKLGDVSERIVATNSTGGSRNVAVTFYIPDEITTDNTFQIYRTKQTTDDTQLFLVSERAPTSGEIAAQVVTFDDAIEDSQLGITLYTSFEDGGLAQGNAQPPIANDITFFKKHIIYSNIIQKHRFFLQLAKITSGLQNDDTITIGSRTYTAKSVESVGSQQFELATGGTEAENIEATARSLIKVINLDTGNTQFYAYYNSTVDDPTGKILLEERGIGGAAFSLSSTRPTAWLPEIVALSGSPLAPTIFSDNEPIMNGVMISKLDQPEAVPISSLQRVGSANYPIRRTVALRDFVFFFKDDGLFWMVGEAAPFEIKEFDLTVKILVDASACALADNVYCYTQQGPVVIDAQGATPIAFDVEQDLLELQALPAFNTATFGLAYESERKYELYTVSSSVDTNATQAYVFNTKTKQWTTYVCGEISAGHVLTRDNKLYLAAAEASGSPLLADIYQERKEFTRFDNADESYAITITDLDDFEIEVADASNIEVGDTIKQEGRTAVVTEIDGMTLTLSASKSWELDVAEVYRPVRSVMEFSPFHLGTPGAAKTFDEIYFLFRDAKFETLTVKFATNFYNSSAFTEGEIEPVSFSGKWPPKPWGSGEWGGGPGGGQQIVRVDVPRAARTGNWLKIRIEHGQAFTTFAIEGIIIKWRMESERIK